MCTAILYAAKKNEEFVALKNEPFAVTCLELLNFSPPVFDHWYYNNGTSSSKLNGVYGQGTVTLFRVSNDPDAVQFEFQCVHSSYSKILN